MNKFDRKEVVFLKIDDLNSYFDFYLDSCISCYRSITKKISKSEHLLARCNHKFGRSDYFNSIFDNLNSIYRELERLYGLMAVLESKYNNFYDFNK